MPHSKLLADIVPSSKIIKNAMSLPIQHPWTQVVTLTGNAPWLMVPNDGVVTLQSMKARTDIDMIEVDLNHYEIVISPMTVDIIRDRIKSLEPVIKRPEWLRPSGIRNRPHPRHVPRSEPER